jgi:hypothetical protein
MPLANGRRWKAKRCAAVLLKNKDNLRPHKKSELHLKCLLLYHKFPWVVVQKWGVPSEWVVCRRYALGLTLVLGVPTGFQSKAVLNTNNSYNVYVVLIKVSDE